MEPMSGGTAAEALLHVMGCRLNHAEAASIAGALESAGWRVATDGDLQSGRFSLYVLHSCAVTGEATKEALRRVRSAARAGVSDIIVSGCAASVEEKSIRQAGATVVLSRRAPAFASSPCAAASAGEIAAQVVDSAQRGLSSVSALHPSVRAPVKIQDGCSFRCSYCIVPDARGQPHSRKKDDILQECASLVGRGYRELVLSGVNAAFWRDGKASFVDLVREVAQIPGILRVRLGSIEPGTCEGDMARLVSALGPKACRFFHLPLQSGSDRILAAMRRHYSVAQFRVAARDVLRHLPDAGLGTDVMTGFPGETESDFQRTFEILQELPFSNFHVFPFSERPGTDAAAMPEKVPMELRRERARALVELGRRKRTAFARSFVGKSVDILVEKVASGGVASGWTGEYLRASVPCRIDGDVGTLLRARVEAVCGAELDQLRCSAAIEG